MSDLKIFHVATDFIVAKTADEAKKFYLEMIGEKKSRAKSKRFPRATGHT